MKNYPHLITLFLCMASLSPNVQGEGGIETDGTVGPVQTLTGMAVDIPQTLGTTVGNNLFHSFKTFNINQGQTVTFQENTTNTLDNVISRVTGGMVSDINGSLVSTPGGHANFYLVNPAGVMFGNGASIDVKGDFIAQLRFINTLEKGFDEARLIHTRFETQKDQATGKNYLISTLLLQNYVRSKK